MDICQYETGSIFIMFKPSKTFGHEYLEITENDLFLFPEKIPVENKNLSNLLTTSQTHHIFFPLQFSFSKLFNWLKCKIHYGS